MTQRGELLQFCSRETTKVGCARHTGPFVPRNAQISQIRQHCQVWKGHGVIWAARSLCARCIETLQTGETGCDRACLHSVSGVSVVLLLLQVALSQYLVRLSADDLSVLPVCAGT
jgi:hypothetical protein